MEGGPFPRIGFATDDGDGADALEGEDVEYHEGDSEQGGVDLCAIGALLALKGLGEGLVGSGGEVFRTDVVNGGHGADEDFAGGEGGDDSDADFPVESEGFDEGFDEVAEFASEAVTEFFSGF